MSTTVRTQASYPINPAYQNLIQGLSRQPLNASRSFNINRGVHGLQEGAPILHQQETLLPRTGIAPIDQANTKVSSLTQFGRNAVSNTIGSTVKGGFYGFMCGLLVAALGTRTNLLQVFQKKVPWVFLGALALLGPAGGMLGSALGFLQSLRKNKREVQNLLGFGAK